MEYESVKNGDKEAVVPKASGGHEYVSPEGVKVRQTYVSGADGQNIITILDFNDKQWVRRSSYMQTLSMATIK